jgi:hypothetical protein
MLRIGTWPAFFTSMVHAQTWTGSVVALDDVRFEGVQNVKFRVYVTYNKARRAWEQGLCEIGSVPEGWRRRAGAKNGKSKCSRRIWPEREKALTHTSSTTAPIPPLIHSRRHRTLPPPPPTLARALRRLECGARLGAPAGVHGVLQV